MRINLPETAVISDRFGVSERATAAIATSVLKDLQIVTDTDLTFVIDKNKIRREKSKIRKALQQEPKTMSEALTSLYFDGRKDETLYQEEVGSKRYRKTRKEEHVSIIMEPGSQYITHVTPISDTSKGITESMISHLNEMEFDFRELLLVGCDGTATNTGWRGGIIRRIELYLNRPIQWNICLLHANELPLRHVFQHFDGKTSGPNSFSGTIGKQLQGVEHLPVVNFNKIECDLVQVTCRDNLSKDQKYLYDIGQAIHLGNCSSDLSLRDPGKLSHARWLTLGNRTLRLYISSEDPSENLVHIVTFIMKVYLPMWFQIKLNDSIADGARHVFTMIKNSRYLPEHLLRVVDPVIQPNAYFAHPENLLLSMVTDENRNVRKIGVQRILKARETTSTAKNSVRSFILPKLNFNATNYYEMIDWSSTILSPPPVLRNVLNADLLSSIDNQPSISQWNLSSFPCHTQAVERTVKLVTEASNKFA
ncbi:uncharacterized protein LOC128869586 [Anastrepha ludens]|uniref:uncharacterized protein LOC128869235 n=1 Tax=Anastrepha ludens TaxID=28586 RepID=UPI0023AEE419|nr:uncharacterized protein LOC128869235 [Anastrepha ludens]XP_053968126.1 uncharacterized protein LOC128869586 [Anastrepha ludens]